MIERFVKQSSLALSFSAFLIHFHISQSCFLREKVKALNRATAITKYTYSK